MAIYRVQGPDGSVHKFEGPDDATPQQIESFAAQQFGGAREEERYDPTEGMSGGEKFLAGVGMGMTNVGRGVGQAVGLVDRADIEEARRLDAALGKTGAGMAGNVVGTVAAYAPTAFIPGANTMAGAAAIGAGSGFLAPSTSTRETITNTALGGTLAPATLGAIRAVPAITQGTRALVEPFTRGGQANIAGRTLATFAGNRQAADDAAAAMLAGRAEVAGVQNTAGELSGNAGIAQLERTLRQNPEVAQAMTERLQANRGALLQAVQGVAGDDAAMAAAVQARQAASSPLYAASRAQNILPDQEFALLAQRPAMQQAMQRAEGIMNEGGQATPGAFLHSVKMALDDMLQTGPQRGIGNAEANSIRNTRGEFIRWLETRSPEYGAARTAHREGSRPINQMEIGRDLLNRFQPALADFGANTRTTAATYARALRDADQTAARATGMPNAQMADVLTPQQMQTVTGVARELAKRATADELGRIPGSPTAQNLVSQNLLRQVLGPLGLPESVAEGTLVNSLMRLPQFAARLGEQRVVNRLAEALLDPQQAAQLMQGVNQPSLVLRGANALQPFGPAAALSVQGSQ